MAEHQTVLAVPPALQTAADDIVARLHRAIVFDAVEVHCTSAATCKPQIVVVAEGLGCNRVGIGAVHRASGLSDIAGFAGSQSSPNLVDRP